MTTQILENRDNQSEGTAMLIPNTNNFPLAKLFPTDYAKELKLLAKKQLIDLTSEWESQIEKVVDFNSLKEWGGSKAEAVESYIQSKLRAEIRTIKKSYSLLTSIAILETGVSRLIESKEISTVDSLLNVLPEVNVNNPNSDLNRFRTALVLHLQKRILKGCKIREEKIVNGEFPYISQERFCKLAAWSWVSKNCFDNPVNCKR